MVEDLILQEGGRVVWIDLDTLVFVDLARAFQRGAASWMVGYQKGIQCKGLTRLFQTLKMLYSMAGTLPRVTCRLLQTLKSITKKRPDWRSRA